MVAWRSAARSRSAQVAAAPRLSMRSSVSSAPGDGDAETLREPSVTSRTSAGGGRGAGIAVGSPAPGVRAAAPIAVPGFAAPAVPARPHRAREEFEIGTLAQGFDARVSLVGLAAVLAPR